VVQHITVNGGNNSFSAQATSIQASGDVSGVSGGHIEQSVTSTGLQPEVVLAFISQYRAALTELDRGTQQAAQAHLDQLTNELSAYQPNENAVNQHLHTPKALASHALSAGLAKAASAGGSIAMSALLDQWPFG
jgi:hypothetical protein